MESFATRYQRELASLLKATEVSARATAGTVNLDTGVDRFIGLVRTVKQTGRTVYVIGNGGSAAIASHVQNDLCKALAIKAQCFYDLSLYAAIANDDGAQAVFARPLKLFASEGDLLIAISSSGRSENILRAAAVATEAKSQVVTLSGFDPQNPLRATGDLNFYTPSNAYGFVELSHQIICHMMTDGLLG